MVEAPSPELGPGAILRDRYRILEAAEGPRALLAEDEQEKRKVQLVFVSAAHAGALKPALTLQHQHLAHVYDVFEAEGGHWVASEPMPGISLRVRLLELKKKAPVDAVRMALRAADALTSLHDHGAVHGLVHPESLIVTPDRPGPAPVLAFVPPSDGVQTRAPGGDTDAPSPADDAWAVAALLHWMLVGSAPPADGYRDEGEIARAGVDDPELRVSLLHGLAADAAMRSKDLRPLRRELARWFVEHAAEESIPPGRHSREPPPLPSSGAQESSGSFVATKGTAKKRGSHFGALAVAAIGLGLVGGWLFSSLRPKKPEVEIVTVARSAEPAASAPEIDLTEVPVTGEVEGIAGDKLASCVSGYLPPNTFGKAPDLAWVCSETHPKSGADKLRVAVVGSAPRGQVTDAMKIFAKIGWYDMAAFAVVRAGCCPEAAPIQIEGLSDSCPRMDESLRELGEAVVAAKPPEAALKKYTDSIHCELNLGHGGILRRKERPVGGEDTAFLDLVKKLEH